ncbi:MAG: insulinase family protein [Candidatus Omnitrophica bacterium]|nr:insulinase family protein [Candidatus Omnitrophota bacterium]
MCKKISLYICALFLCFVLNLNTGTGNCAQNPLSKYASSFPQIYEHNLENGLNVLIQEKHESNLVAFEIIVKTGSLFEENKQGSGLAHLVEHMVFKGTQKRGALKIDDEIKALGGSINGYTSHQFTGYTLVLPAENFEAGLEILSDMLMNPVFDDIELKKEKDVILSEIKMNRDDPQRYFQNKFWQHANLINPYNLPVIGVEPLFVKLTVDDLRSFHSKWYIPNNMIIAVAGSIDPETAFGKIKEHFRNFPMGHFPDGALPQIPPLKARQYFEEEYDVTTSRMMLGFSSVVLTDKDSASLDILATLLGTGESSRLYEPVLKQKQLVYSINSFNYTPGFRGVFAISAILDFKNKDAAIKEIFKIIDELKITLVSKKEMEKVKNIYISNYIFSQETVASLAKALATDKAYTNNAYFSYYYLENITSITPSDIQRCAKKYLSNEDFITVVLKPFSVKASDKAPRKDEKREIKKITLKNGARLLLKKDTSIAGVSMQAGFEGGARRENDSNSGLFNLLSKMLLRGTKKRSACAIANECEQMGAEISSFSGYNSFGISMNFLSKDITGAFDIFSDLILNSDFPIKELELEKRLALKGLELENDDIFQSTFNLLKEQLFSDYPYRLNPRGNAKAVASMKPDELRRAYKEFVNAPNLVLSVFGNFDENKVEEMIKEKFEKLRTAPMPASPGFNEKSSEENKRIENQRDKKQALLMIGFPGCDVKNTDSVKLEFLDSLLSGSGSILYKNIREKYGFSYTLGGSCVSGLDTGFLYIYAATKPEVIEEVKMIVFDEINKIKNGIIDDTAVEITKKFLIAKKRIALESNSALGFTVALNELYGLGSDYHEKYEGFILEIDKEAIQNTANRYLDLNKSVIIITKDKF